MEGCPRSLMLNVDLKETFPTEFTPSLKTYIREHYNEDADSYKNECSQLEQLRAASIRPSRDHSGCSTLRRYNAQLQYLQSRFPMGDGGAVNVQFTWTDLYSEEPISLCDIRFEQASILHNLAALHSQLGCNEDRTTEEGMKVACTHFQAAAGIFQYLKAGSFCKVEHFIDHFASDAFFDMAGGLLQLYTNVMLGQAQECLLEKSILDSRKDSLIARISMQVHDYYNQALQFLDSQGPSYMGSRKAKIWTKNLKIKCCQYLAVAYIHMSNHADENQKFGEKVAYLKAASQKITEAQKASKGQPERTLDLLQFLVDVVSNKLQGAVKDNDFIYHEVVPELDTLPEIKAAPLVKPIPFQPLDSSVSGPDIFQRLIPMDAHTDASLYSEEKAKLLRRYVGSIEQKNQVLSKALSDLHIDDLLEPEGYDTLPAAIVQKSNSLKKDGNLKDVENNVEELTKVGSKVEELLNLLSKILEEDKRREKELKEFVGSMTPPPEREDFEKDVEQCRESHKKATQTNTELLKVFKEHKHNLDLLVGPSEGLLAALPSLNIIDTPIDDGAVQRLRDLISKVELMKSQRKQLEGDLRKQLEDDDITQLLVTREGNKTIFFEEQLKKHDATCDLIQKNLDAQSKILKALTEANAKYAPTRQAVKETAQRRDDAVQTFVLSHDTFFELKEKLSRGLRFYQGLEKTVLKLEEKLKEFAENRKKEMDKIEEKEKKAKAKVPPARPGAEKPDHLVNPPASSVPGPMVTQYPGGPGMIHPGVRPGAPHPNPQGVPFQPRIPGGAFPPGSLPGAIPRPADPRMYLSGSQGVPARPPFPPSDKRMRAPQPGVPPQPAPDSRTHQIFPEQRVPQAPGSPAAGPPMRPSNPPQPSVPFSQMGPRGPTPTDHLIHSTPKMSYPVPLGPSLPPGGSQGFQASVPGGPYQVPQPPGQQPRPQLAPGQVPGGAQGLPSYDQAKFMPGSQPLSRTQQPPAPPPQSWPQGQHPPTSQQQPGGPQLHPSQLNRPPNVTPQQQFQAPRGPHPASQTQHPSHAGSPQMYPQKIPSSQISQPLQPSLGQHQPKNWPTQPFQFPKLAQQSLQPQQQFQQPQQPYQRQQLQPQHPQQQQQPPPSQQQFQQPPPGQPQFPPPLQPQKVLQPQPQIQQKFLPQQPSQLHQKSPQQPLQFQPQQPPQQHQHPSQPPQQFQQPMQQFNQPGQMQPQFSQPRQQSQHPREPLQPTQFQQPQQQQQQKQQFQPPLQPQQNYQQQLQPLQPQKSQQQYSQFQPTLQPQPRSMQQHLQDQQMPTDRLPLQTLHPEQTPSQIVQTSLGPLKPQQISHVPELPPKGQSQISQMPGPSSWQKEGSNLPLQPQRPGYPIEQPYTGYSQTHQPPQASNTSAQLGYPVLPEKKRSQTDQFPPKASHSALQHPGAVQSSPHEQNTYPGQSQSWGYPQASQPLPSTGSPLSSQQFSRQDSTEQQGFGGKQMQGPQKPMPYKQKSIDQGWGPSFGAQQPPQGRIHQDQAAYPPVIGRQNSSDYGKQGETRGRLASYPPYSGVVSEPSSPSPAGSQPYSFSPGDKPTAPPLVQGVRPSPTSLPPSSAYATSYSVSVAQAQLSQQQQMQQLQTQMLLQQQQLILQQQELLRHQQQQQQHDSDQGHLTQLFQQVLQQQTKLAEMEHKLAEHERHEEQLKKGLIEHEETSPAEKDTKAADKDPQATPPHSSSSFNASWGTGFSDHVHNKLDMEQVFSDLAKKQINEISEKGKHTDGTGDSFKPVVHGDNEGIVTKKDSGTSEHLKELVGDESTEEKGALANRMTNSVDAKATAQIINTEMENETPEKGNKESESSISVERKVEGKSEVDVSSSTEGKPEDESQKAEDISNEDKEKKRRQEIDEQIQKIKELQKNTQPAPPPLPQKRKYLYEPGKMPELNQLPLKPPDTVTNVEPSKPSLHRQCGHYYSTQYSSIGQAENNECLSEEEYIQRLSRTVETFDALVVSLSQKRENSPYNGFINEWKVLERMQENDSAVFSTQVASLNPSKNRYRDILPWDHTRVKLTTKEGGDYINANLIKKVTPLSPDYILTQGPIAATLEDFWLLVWEQKSPVVVMLTKEVEGNRLKCHQYWPIDEGHTVVYGAIRVHMRSMNHCQAWIERVMHVQHAESDEVLVVSHLQFIGWPDHGVPHSPSDLLTFLSEVHNTHQERDPQAQRPLVVHCSAGVGRAGTFCVVYTAIRELNGTGNIVNIPKLVRIFRQHRKFTVQKKEQYEFCYRAVLFYANQFAQLEKTAIAFKKSKATSRDQAGDVSSTSSETALSASGQQKPPDVSFLGEISSDEDSSDSGSEFEKEEENGLSKIKSSQGLGKSEVANAEIRNDEFIRTDQQSSELKDSSETTSNPPGSDKKNIPHTSETSTVRTDLPTVMAEADEKRKAEDSASQNLEVKDPSPVDTLVMSTANTDLSATIKQTKGNRQVEESSAQDTKLNVSSVNPSDIVKDTTDTFEASRSSEDLSAVTEKSTEKLEADDSSEKQKDFISNSKSCDDDKVEETKTSPASLEKEGDVKRDHDKVDDCKEKAEEEPKNTMHPISVSQNEQNIESDISDEKTSLGKTPEETGPRQEQENQNKQFEAETLKQENSEAKDDEVHGQQVKGDDEHAKKEQHESPDIEQNTTQTEQKKPDDQVSENDKHTESSKGTENDSLKQAKQDSEIQETVQG